jgi:hypothetical protein
MAEDMAEDLTEDLTEDVVEGLTACMRLEFFQPFPPVELLALARGDFALLDWSRIPRLPVVSFHSWRCVGLGGS